jgi:hypothetical protein
LNRHREVTSGDETASGLLGDDLAVLPKIYGSAVHARYLARRLSGSSHPATDAGGKTLRLFRSFTI